MKLAFSVLAVVCLAGPAWAQSDKSAKSETQVIMPEPSMRGVHWAKGVEHARPARPGGGGSPNLTYHGGPIVATSTFVQPIFWGDSWQQTDPKVGAMDTFYTGSNGSSYLGTNTEYTNGSSQHVSTAVTVGNAFVDNASAPRRAPSTSAVLAEVCSQIGSSAVSNGYYPVYVDTPRGHAGYCAWHSWGSCGGVPITFAFFFNLDGDPGCDPGDTTSGHDQGVAALGNVSGHELSEMLTDSRGNAWYDSTGYENADKCAWKFGSQLLTFTDSAHTKWMIQGNWSNDAYNNKQGYGGNRGCIDGTNQ